MGVLIKHDMLCHVRRPNRLFAFDKGALRSTEHVYHAWAVDIRIEHYAIALVGL
jgi:hypothetical protein